MIAEIEAILQQGRMLGTKWAQEMLARHERAISIGSGAGSLWNRAKAIVTNIVDKVEQALSGLDVPEGEDPEQVVQETIDQLVVSMPGMVASTEVQTAIESAVYDELAAQNEIPSLVWVTQPDACPLCLANEAMGVVPLGTDFNGVVYPPAHPNCRCHLEMPFT